MWFNTGTSVMDSRHSKLSSFHTLTLTPVKVFFSRSDRTSPSIAVVVLSLNSLSPRVTMMERVLSRCKVVSSRDTTYPRGWLPRLYRGCWVPCAWCRGVVVSRGGLDVSIIKVLYYSVLGNRFFYHELRGRVLRTPTL